MSQAATNLLSKALSILDRDGWCRQNYVKANGNKCVIGALGTALFEDEHLVATEETTRLGVRVVITAAHIHPVAQEATERLVREIEVQRWFPDNPIGRIISWNDNPARSYEDVVLALKKAIEND